MHNTLVFPKTSIKAKIKIWNSLYVILNLEAE